MSVSLRRCALLALGVCALAAPAASAATFEQISRETGAAGTGTITFPSTTGLTSDSGVYGTFTRFTSLNSFFSTTETRLRNIATNRTTVLPGPGGVIGWDRTERIALRYRYDAPTGVATYSVGPLTGGAPDVLSLSPAGQYSTPILSGDGKTLVYLHREDGVYRYDIATKTATKLPGGDFELSQYSVSDDASVVAGLTYDGETNSVAGVYVRGGVRTTTPGQAQVSPDGKMLYHRDRTAGANTLVVRVLATGAERRSPVPASLGTNAPVIWMAADGKRVALGPLTEYDNEGNPVPPTAAAQVFTLPLGNWSRFGGAYARYFADYPGTAISRNGLYAQLAINDDVALVSLGPILPGGGDPLSASAYFGGPGAVRCGTFYSAFTGYLAQPAGWIRPARKATLKVIANGTVLKEATTSTSQPASYLSPNDPAFAISPLPADAAELTVEWTVVDHLGRTLKETYTEPVPCGIG